MRAIDADALKEEIQKVAKEEGHLDEKWSAGLRYSIKLIDNAPSVPTLSEIEKAVVRCEGFKEGYKVAKYSVIPEKKKSQGEWVGISDFLRHMEELTDERYSVNTYYDGNLYCNHCWMAGGTKKTDFCPNCGAEMRKGGTE